MASPDLSTLDLATKVRLLTGASFFTLHGEESIGLLPMSFSDGPTGVRGLEFTGGPLTCLFPNATLLAASWDEDVLRETGRLLAEEAFRQQIHVVLGPTINLHRSALGGRVFEAFSEDPLLTGRLAAAYVDGLQGLGVGACLKHLVANESETDRRTVDSRVDEATLREVYLLPFEIAVQDSNPWSVMSAYNDVNGFPATEQRHVQVEVLRDDWGWDGLVMSDWFAAKSAGPAANGGLDLVMPGPVGPWGAALVAAVESGEVDEAVLDEKLRRLLLLAERVGAAGQGRSWPEVPAPDSEERQSQLLELAARGMTVLSNDGVLPLAPDARIALVGRHAVDTVNMGGGSAVVRAPHQRSVADGFAGRGAEVTVVDGVEVRQRPRKASEGVLSDPVSGEPGIRVRLLDDDGEVTTERHTGEALELVGIPGVRRPAQVELTAVVPAGRMRVGVVGPADWTLTVAGESHRATPAMESGDGAEAVLFPPGWQTVVDLDEPTVLTAVATLTLDTEHSAGLVAEPAPPGDDAAIATAVEAARDADVAVVVVGLTEEQETEGLDKATLALPGRQDELVSSVAAVAPRTVVVVNSATPVLMPWRDEVAAVVVVGLPGQEGGLAVTAALYGDVEPSGRLVSTWPAADGAAPAWSVTPVDGALPYTEGPFIGYRGHMAGRAPAPAYWFGHGLGLASWGYGDARADGTTVTVEVTNTSERDAREVVQVYLDPQDGDQPVRLVGWSGVQVAAGATEQVTVRCDERMWRRWDEATASWARLDGGELLVARGLGDVRARVPAR